MTLDRAPASTDPTLSAGVVLADKYRLERELGRGAMGTVWRATHVTLEQVVAIKIISREHSASAELRQRVSTEARAAAKLRSRHVVGVYDHGETEDGLPFIVLEYLEGETLEDRLTREGPLPLRDTVRVVRHVGRALSRAHAHAIVHRDLKPANIFITRTEDDERDGWLAKVLDFGVAKMNYSGKTATKTGALIGTPLFMSPEQVRGASDIDHRADLYSLGMVFYNTITGKYAFDGATFGDLLISICTDPLPSLRQEAPWASAELEAWFRRACARAPEDRFVDADEMVEALEVAAGLTDLRPSLVDGGRTSSSVGGRPLGADAPITAKGHPPPDGPRSAVSPGSTVPPTELTSSSISSPGAAITVHLPPPRRSRAPWVIGSAVLAAGLAVALSSGLSGTSHEATGQSSAGAELSTASQGAESAPSTSNDSGATERRAEPTRSRGATPSAGDAHDVHDADVLPPPTDASLAASTVEAAAQPARVQTSTASPSLPTGKAQATKAQPARTQPARVEPARVEPARVEPARAQPPKAQPARTQPAKVEPAKVEPARTQPPAGSAETPPPKTPPPAASAPRLPDLGF